MCWAVCFLFLFCFRSFLQESTCFPVLWNTDIVLHAMDFKVYNQILSLASGKNQKPLPRLFQDYNSELWLPAIYCRQVRPAILNRSISVHYSTTCICKWELHHVDRRTAMCMPNIFFFKLKFKCHNRYVCGRPLFVRCYFYQFGEQREYMQP